MNISVQTIEGDIIEVPSYASKYCFLFQQIYKQSSHKNEEEDINSLWTETTIPPKSNILIPPCPEPIDPDSPAIIHLCLNSS